MKQVLFITITILLLATVIANSQTRLSRKEYIDLYKNIAIREMHRSGIPASITMAQGCLESQNGNSTLAKNSNNHFGIKCKTGWEGPRVYHNDDEINECFRKYETVKESYDDHTNFLLFNRRYSELFKYSKTDYKSWARGLKKAGYATDPKYADRLIQIIEEEKLHALDLVKLEDLPKEETQESKGEPFSAQNATQKIKETLNKITLNPYSKRSIDEKNGLDVIIVEGGDTYESIAREMDMKLWEIYQYNDLSRDAKEPEPNTFLYIERKRYNAPKGFDFHIVKPKESLQEISQKYGMKMSSLYRKNRMKKNTEPKVGQKLYLRKRIPKTAIQH